MIDLNIQKLLLEKYKAEFEKYLKLLLKWNKTYNLTAITDSKEIWERHFLDSIAPLPFFPENGTLLDIGTGAGFPGIPIKIVRPHLSVTLIESSRKKCNFCETVIRDLGLKNIDMIHGRVEKLEIGDFDIIISRATFHIDKLIDLGKKISKGSRVKIIVMKSDLKELEGKPYLYEAEKYYLGNNLKRYVIVVSL